MSERYILLWFDPVWLQQLLLQAVAFPIPSAAAVVRHWILAVI